MKLFNNLKKGHWILLGIWFLINLLQAYFTDLHSDESYYWIYSQNLAFGYFDHPPFAAWLINAGYSIFQMELGVRLFFIIVSSLTIALIINELNEQKDLFFLCLFVLSFPLVHTHIGGFLSIPDVPMVFFSLWFFILFKKFLEKPKLLTSVLLGFVVAAMVYSKYHTILVILLTLVANLKLLKNKYFWLIAVLATLILLPHIWWQIDNQFPTFRYHLSERAKPFRFKYVPDNIISQILIAGPLTGVIVLWKLFRHKIRNAFERTLIVIIVGFYAVLFVFSFWNRIEAHWTAVIIPPIMLLTYPLIKDDPKAKKWFKILALPIVVLFFAYRLYLGINAIPNVGKTKITFYKRGEAARDVQKFANGKKVAFFNNYAITSNYIFYTGEPAVMLSNPGYRFCQYDLLNDEAYADGDSLFIVYPHRQSPVELTKIANGEMKGFRTIEKFQSLKNLNLSLIKAIKNEKDLELQINLTNNSGKIIQLDDSTQPSLAWKQVDKEISIAPIQKLTNKEFLEKNEVVMCTIFIPLSEISNHTHLTIYTYTSENNRGELLSFKI